MHDTYGINDNGVKPRTTCEELVNCVDYPIKYPDRTATCIRDSPLLTQLDGIGMIELEEQQRREKVERQKEDMIREIAAAAGQSAQMLRAIYRRAYNALIDSLIVNRIDDIDGFAQL